MKIEILLSRLKKVKRTGNGIYLARCPAHDDRSPSLGIKEVDGLILIKCFAGCDTTEVLRVIGMKMADLFPDRVPAPDGPKPKFPKFNASDLFLLLVQEATILALACSDLLIKGSLSDADKQRAQQACECVMRLYVEVSR